MCAALSTVKLKTSLDATTGAVKVTVKDEAELVVTLSPVPPIPTSKVSSYFM